MMYRLVLPRRFGVATMMRAIPRIAAAADVPEGDVWTELCRRVVLSYPDQHLPDVIDGLELAVAEGTWPAR